MFYVSFCGAKHLKWPWYISCIKISSLQHAINKKKHKLCAARSKHQKYAGKKICFWTCQEQQIALLLAVLIVLWCAVYWRTFVRDGQYCRLITEQSFLQLLSREQNIKCSQTFWGLEKQCASKKIKWTQKGITENICIKGQKM